MIAGGGVDGRGDGNGSCGGVASDLYMSDVFGVVDMLAIFYRMLSTSWIA